MNGVVVIDKPSGRTSHDVVMEVKHVLHVQKAGHTGTLDPLATGVLPVCINEATKLVQFLVADTKDYRATMRLGLTTDTQDIQGKIVARNDPGVNERDIEETLRGFVGKREQIPPRYSAIKFHGRAFYSLARKGVDVEPPKRMIEIFSVVIEKVELPYVVFTVSCSKGTYIRSLCSDAGEMLGCGACLAGLRRLRSGSFLVTSAVSLDNLEERQMREILTAHIIPMTEVLSDIPNLIVDGEFAERLRRGHQPHGDDLRRYHTPSLAAGDMVKFIDSSANLIAVAKMLYSFDHTGSVDGKRQVVRILRIFSSGP
ncbi:MAG: tRNA pseudouridine(55) synthase TruB [Deltaproteobacteria bacterium]|nr:tRNA pseudouridine(55) synthase TruB [Deltaproteobacteria bacterium]